MRLQRPIVRRLTWLGYLWPLALRLAPRSRTRLAVPPPANDNRFPVWDHYGCMLRFAERWKGAR